MKSLIHSLPFWYLAAKNFMSIPPCHAQQVCCSFDTMQVTRAGPSCLSVPMVLLRAQVLSHVGKVGFHLRLRLLERGVCQHFGQPSQTQTKREREGDRAKRRDRERERKTNKTGRKRKRKSKRKNNKRKRKDHRERTRDRWRRE